MALRKLRLEGDDILRKKSRVVKEVNDKIKNLVEDMIETMYDNQASVLQHHKLVCLRESLLWISVKVQ